MQPIRKVGNFWKHLKKLKKLITKKIVINVENIYSFINSNCSTEIYHCNEIDNAKIKDETAA
jgi:hypothetical protein